MTPEILHGMEWIGTVAGIAGAVLIAARVSISGWGFVLFLVSSLAWLAAGVAHDNAALILLQGAFTAINLLGIWRWLFQRSRPRFQDVRESI